VKRRAAAAALLAAVLAPACAARRPPRPLVPVRQAPDFADDLDLASLRTAVERNEAAPAGLGEQAATNRRLLAVIQAAAAGRARRAAILREFTVVRLREPLLLTAYYEPELEARLAPDASFRHPLYARPADLVDLDPQTLDRACAGCRRLSGRLEDGRLRPYFSRGEIDRGALAGRGLEIAWVDDPFALFVLHVQGSGRLRLPDGRLVAARYAGSNGRPYTSLGRTLVERGLLPPEQASLWDIRRVLAGFPSDERQALMAANERYTFFRLMDDAGDPTGSLGVPLTAGRSVATDPRRVPPGALVYLETPSARRFVVSQDTGGAVTGAHADLFLGRGADAEARAGRTRDRGTLYLLLPR
jgi:membrane-bound lytic murein transglycosylase A